MNVATDRCCFIQTRLRANVLRQPKACQSGNGRPAVGRVHPGDAGMWVPHESIYRDVYMPSRKAFDARMFHRLRSGRSIRRPPGKRSSHGRGQLRNTVSIQWCAVRVSNPGPAD